MIMLVLYNILNTLLCYKKGGKMDKKIALVCLVVLLTMLAGCRKKTRQQKKIDRVTKERIISNF
jgi:hypothetical protein